MWYIGSDTGSTYYIAHHGILGQKWGIRRYQNKDGSLTEEGKRRAMQGNAATNKILRKGIGKAETSHIRATLAKNFSPVTGAATGFAIGSAYGPVGSVAGTLAGTVAGVGLGYVRGKHHETKAKMTALQYNELVKRMRDYKDMKDADSDLSAVDNAKTKEQKTKAINNAVKQAKKTGLYDMEFLERNLDIDDRTGEKLDEAALDNAYRKFLKSKLTGSGSKSHK